MKRLIEDVRYFMEAGGAAAGKLEIAKTKVGIAKQYAEKLFKSNGRTLEEEVPNFDANYNIAQKLAKGGYAMRKDMPVIDNRDIRLLQKRLSSGTIDISRPFADNTVPNDPFPQGLDTQTGKEWVTGGLAKNDGDAKDTSKLLNEYVKSMSSMGNLSEDESELINDNEDDDDVLKRLYKETKKGIKKTKDYTPVEAQLATYKMIDNAKELETLMKRLTPTLKIGHSLMKNFEKLGFKKPNN